MKMAITRMTASIRDIFDVVNDLRLHVLFNYFLVVSWFLYSSKVSVSHSVTYAVVAVCAAGFAYLLNRYTDYGYDVIVDRGLRKAPRRAYLMFSGGFLLIGLYAFSQNLTYLLPILVGMVAGILYSVKTFFAYPIKNYFLIKNIFAAGSKYLVTLGGVLLFVPWTEMLFVRSISMFAFHIIYEILWDIRDMKSDTVGKVRTIPLRIGKDNALLLCGAIWLASLFFQLPTARLSDHFFLKYIMVSFFILSLVRIKSVRWFHIMVYAHLILNLIFVNSEVIVYMRKSIL